MTSAGPRQGGLVRVLAALRATARAQADDVLAHLPDTGDPATGRAVDDFVEQAADALRALDEALALTLRDLGSPTGATGPTGPTGATGATGANRRHGRPSDAGGWSS